MAADNDGGTRQSLQQRERLGWLLSFVTLGLYVAFIAGLIYAKDVYGAAIVAGRHLTFAALATLLLIVLLIGLNGYFLHRSDYRPPRAGDES